MEDLNQGPPDFKSSALNHSTTSPPLVIQWKESASTREHSDRCDVSILETVKKTGKPGYSSCLGNFSANALQLICVFYLIPIQVSPSDLEPEIQLKTKEAKLFYNKGL